MEKKRRKEKKPWRSPTYDNNKKSVFVVYLVLRIVVIALMVLTIIDGNYENTFICVLVLVLFMLPDFIEKRLRIKLPSTLEIIILLFIFAAEILGEVGAYFVRYANWDTVLHSLNGFVCAAFGYALVDLLNREERFSMKLAPIYLAIVAFCFSMTIGVIWEFFEFGVDRFLGKDMQKDTVIHAFSSVMLDPTNSNIPIRVSDITDVAVNGQSLGLDGYLDIGLYDTMEDLFVNFIGAVVFSIVGYISARRKETGKFASRFIPVIDDGATQEKEEGAIENEDQGVPGGDGLQADSVAAADNRPGRHGSARKNRT